MYVPAMLDSTCLRSILCLLRSHVQNAVKTRVARSINASGIVDDRMRRDSATTALALT